MVDDTIRLHRAADRVMALAPDRPEGHLLRGMAHQKGGRHDMAVAEFGAAARLSPSSAEPLLLKGISLERSGAMDEATQAYRDALRLRPDDERGQRLLAAVENR